MKGKGVKERIKMVGEKRWINDNEIEREYEEWVSRLGKDV